MPQIISESAFNPAALQVDDLYIVIQPPPSFITGVPTDVGAFVGTASWGPLNTPLLMNSPTDLAAMYGAISSASPADTHDLATQVQLAFAQAQGGRGSLQAWGVRVSDGSDTPATGTLMDSGGPSAAGANITAIFTGVLGAGISVIISPGNGPNYWNASVIGFAGGASEVYQNIKDDGAGSFWAQFIFMLANGQSSIRGPSRLIKAALPNTPSTNPPIAQTITLTGGSDGRSGVTKVQLVGSDTAVPKTGVYALRGMNPAVGVLGVCGLIDSDVYSTLSDFADSEGMDVVFNLATGTSTADAITLKNGLGIASFEPIWMKDWIYFYDPTNGYTRLVSPEGVTVGGICVLNPSLSPSNKPVYGIVGTERYNILTGQILPYTPGEAGQLEVAGINVITNPSVGGQYFGFRMGVNAMGNDVTGPIEYGRMTNWLSHTFANTMGKYVGQNQSTDPNDPLRLSIKTELDGYLESLRVAGMIDSYQTICGFQASGSPAAGYNTPDSIAKHYVYALVKVRYLASVKFFVLSLLGGTTVVTTGNSLGEALAQ